MKLSLITASYNSAAHIASSLNSIKEQTYPQIEQVIIDGASKDHTLETIQASPNKVSLIISEPDRGIYDALNKGIQKSTGDIIGFLHSDDIFASSYTIQNIANAFLNDKNLSVIYGDLEFVDLLDTNKIVRYWKSQPFKPSLLNWGWMPPHPTVFMRREVYDKHGLFNINLKCAADYDYLLRVFKDTDLKKVYLPEIITKMRIGGVSTKGIWNLLNKKREDYWVLRQHLPYPLWTLICKNIIKIPQLFVKQKQLS